MFGLLQSHFDKVILNPPAKPEAIQTLAKYIGSSLGELEDFLNTYNGLQVELHDNVYGQIFSVEEMLQDHFSVGYNDEYPFLKRLIPIQGNGCGDYYCYMVGNGPGNGSVIFWDHESPEGVSYLAGGTLYSFFKHWIKKLVTCYTSNGKERSEYIPPELNHPPWYGKPHKVFPWPFDTKWLRKNDHRADILLDDLGFMKLMTE